MTFSVSSWYSVDGLVFYDGGVGHIDLLAWAWKATAFLVGYGSTVAVFRLGVL